MEYTLDVMVTITPEEINEAYQKRLAEMSPAERYDEENFSVMGDVPILKRMPINMKAYVYDLLGGSAPYDVGDLQPKEIEQLYKLIYDASKEGQTSGRVDYTNQGGYGDIITTDAREQLQRQIKSEFEDPEKVEAFLSANPQIDSKTFLKQLNDPEFIMKTFLGKFNYRIDDNDNVIITDSYDTNINKGQPEQSGRLQRFFSNLKPGKNYPMSVLSGIAGLLGSAEGKGSPIEINLGTMEDISKELNKQYTPDEQPNRVDELLSELSEEERNGL